MGRKLTRQLLVNRPQDARHYKLRKCSPRSATALWRLATDAQVARARDAAAASDATSRLRGNGEMATLAERRVQRARQVSADRWFYSGMAALLAVTMFVGFAPSYYLHGEPRPGFVTYLDTPPQPIRGLFLLHGAVFTAWFLLQLVQSLLVAGKKLAVHRLVGETALVL